MLRRSSKGDSESQVEHRSDVEVLNGDVEMKELEQANADCLALTSLPMQRDASSSSLKATPELPPPSFAQSEFETVSAIRHNDCSFKFSNLQTAPSSSPLTFETYLVHHQIIRRQRPIPSHGLKMTHAHTVASPQLDADWQFAVSVKHLFTTLLLTS